MVTNGPLKTAAADIKYVVKLYLQYIYIITDML